MDFNNNKATQVIVKLIYQIFSMRQNILKGFNEIFFVHEENVDDYNIFFEKYYKIHIKIIDLKNT